MLDGTWRKQFILNSLFEGGDSLALIEGIGYTGGFLKPIIQMDGFEGASHLSCFVFNNNPLYRSYLFDSSSCSVPTGIYEIIEDQIRIFPVPVNRGNPVYFSGASDVDEVFMYDVCGKLVLSDRIENLNKKVVFPESSSPGLYLCKIWVSDKNLFVMKKLIVQ